MLLKISSLLLALLLSACSQGREAPLYEVKLTQTSLNGVTKNTPFSTQAIAPLFPGFEIKTFQSVASKNSTLLRVFYHGKEWFQIEPTEDKKSIKSLYILDAHIVHTCRIKSKNICKESETLHYDYAKDGSLKVIELRL